MRLRRSPGYEYCVKIRCPMLKGITNPETWSHLCGEDSPNKECEWWMFEINKNKKCR